MLDYDTVFDIKANVADHLATLDHRVVDLDVRVIGEHDGSLVFTCANGKENAVVGLIDLVAKETKVLCTLDRSCNIIQACVKRDQSCLAFVTREKKEDLNTCIEKDEGCWSYEIRLVVFRDSRIQLSGTCIRSESLLQVEFCKNATTNETLDEEHTSCQIIVYNVGTGIDLYSCRFNNDQGVFDCTKTETLTKNFVWAQWLPNVQCLFYLCCRENRLHQHGEFNVDRKRSQPMLKCLQFHDHIHYETVLTLPLEVDESVALALGSRTDAFDYDAVKHIVSGNKILLEVLMQADTEPFYICYQFLTTCDEEEHEPSLNLHYSVVLLHHGTCLNGKIYNFPREYEHRKVSFLFHSGNYILACIPGLFVHLLDVGPEHEPFSGTHILVADSCADSASVPLVKSVLSNGYSRSRC